MIRAKLSLLLSNVAAELFAVVSSEWPEIDFITIGLNARPRPLSTLAIAPLTQSVKMPGAPERQREQTLRSRWWTCVHRRGCHRTRPTHCPATSSVSAQELVVGTPKTIVLAVSVFFGGESTRGARYLLTAVSCSLLSFWLRSTCIVST